MFRLFLTTRRRAFVCTYLAVLGLFILLTRNPESNFVTQPDTPAWIFWTTLGIMGLSAFLISLLTNWLAAVVWPFALIVPFGLSLSLFTQNATLSLTPDWLASEEYGSLLGMMVFVGVIWLFFGPALDRFSMRFLLRDQTRFHMPHPPEEVWDMCRPGRAPLSIHWHPLLTRADPVEDDLDSYELEYSEGSGTYRHMTVTYLEEKPFHRVRYYEQGDVSGPRRDLAEATVTITLDLAKDGGTMVTYEEENTALLPRVALENWLSNYLRDFGNGISARAHGRRDWSLSGRNMRRIKALS